MKYYISGKKDGIIYYLKDSGPIDFSTNYQWTESFADRKILTWDKCVEILDEDFFEGALDGIGGVISENT